MRVRSKPSRFHSSLTFVDDIGLWLLRLHQSEYRSTFDRLNAEISKLMANATPVTDYLSACITQAPDPPSSNAIEDRIENRIHNALDAISNSNSTNGEDADASDVRDELDGTLRSEPEQKLSIASEVRLHSYGMISILFEYRRKCNRLDGGSTIFRDSINVNLALPEADRFAVERMADLSPIFHSCQRLDGIPFFAENGAILCYTKSETENTNRPYVPIKEYSNIELYRQFQEPILKYQFERLLKPPGL